MDFTEEQQALIDENDGVIPPELALQLLDAANGDTVAMPAENGGQPATTQVQTETTPANTDQNTQPQQQTLIDESQLNADNAVILAKDGIHHISYDKLTEARTNEKLARTESQEWKQKFDEAQGQLAQFQADAQQRQANGQVLTVQDQQANIAQQAIEQGVDPAIFGDFDEKGLAAGIEKLVEMRATALIDQRLQSMLAPVQHEEHRSARQAAEQAHFNEILTAHPDAESVVESKEFNDWKTAQPNFMQSAYDTVLNQGSAAEVVELLGLYKSNTQNQAATPPTDVVKAAAQQAVLNAQTPIPNSLSDLPAGSPTGVSPDERYAAMSPAQLSEEMRNWSPEQIQQFLDRRI